MWDRGHSAAKTALRDQVLAARKRRPLEAAAGFAASVADVALAWEPVRSAATVAAYVSVGSEPGTGLLLDALAAAGKRVLLPVVLPGLDLDWAVYTGREASRPRCAGSSSRPRRDSGARRSRRPTSSSCRAPAVSLSGARLGQGGGCYDRALPRVSPGTPVAVVLYDDEVGLAVPAEPHDVRVGYALTSRGVVALGPAGSPDIR